MNSEKIFELIPIQGHHLIYHLDLSDEILRKDDLEYILKNYKNELEEVQNILESIVSVDDTHNLIYNNEQYLKTSNIQKVKFLELLIYKHLHFNAVAELEIIQKSNEFVYLDYDTFLQDKLDELSNDEYDEFIDLEISRINLALLNNKANFDFGVSLYHWEEHRESSEYEDYYEYGYEVVLYELNIKILDKCLLVANSYKQKNLIRIKSGYKYEPIELLDTIPSQLVLLKVLGIFDLLSEKLKGDKSKLSKLIGVIINHSNHETIDRYLTHISSPKINAKNTPYTKPTIKKVKRILGDLDIDFDASLLNSD